MHMDRMNLQLQKGPTPHQLPQFLCLRVRLAPTPLVFS
jgi:hypothetical protein